MNAAAGDSTATLYGDGPSFGQDGSGRQRSYDLAMKRSHRLAVLLLCRARGIRPRGRMRTE